MQFIESFNTCLGRYFGADKHYMVMMMIVTVRLIWLGTNVTWPSCRPLALFLNKIAMDILTGHGHSHGHRKSVSSVFTCRRKLQLVSLLLHIMVDLKKYKRYVYFICAVTGEIKILLFQMH